MTTKKAAGNSIDSNHDWDFPNYLWNSAMRFSSSHRHCEVLDEDLLKATKARRLAGEIRVILRRGAKNTAIDKATGKTALHFAAENHDFATMKYLVCQSGADINCTTSGELDTPLHCSLNAYHSPYDDNHYMEILNFMLDRGANLNAQNKRGQTPLHLAFARDPIFGIPCYKQTNSFALEIKSFSILRHFPDAVKTLLARGARLQTDSQGRFPLHYICGFSIMFINEYSNLLQERASCTININVQDYCGCTPLHMACETGNVEGARWCVQRGADVNARDDRGRRPLHLVCDREPEKKVVLPSTGEAFDLIFCRPHLSRRNDASMDVLARNLIQHGADPLAPTPKGETSFALACWRRNIKVMKAVAGSGAPFYESSIVDAHINSDEETCLHVECRSESGLAKELLFIFRANPNALDCRSFTALDVALAASNLKVVPFLVYRGSTSQKALNQRKIYKIYKSSTETFLEFLKRHQPNLFQTISSTKAFTLAARAIGRYDEGQDDSEAIRAHLFTAIKFRKKFNQRLPNGGDGNHRHFVRVLKKCESILWPYPYGTAIPEIRHESESNYVGMSSEVGDQRVVFTPQSGPVEEDEGEEDYPLSDFFDQEGAWIDEEEIESMSTQDFFAS